MTTASLGSSSLLKTSPIHLGPGFHLYKQPQAEGRGSPFWQVRIRIQIGSKSLFTKSTGTTDLLAAKRIAESFYADLLILRRYGESGLPADARSITKRLNRFDVVADEWLI